MATLLRVPQRVVHTPAADSRRWDRFEPRSDDIVIGTFAKCGTTWTQRIVDLLVFQNAEVRPFGAMSPWLDSKLFGPVEDDLATLKAQTHRRYIKSHLPFDALPVWDTVKYIHVGRDGRDAQLSWQNHEQGFTPEFRANMGVLAGALAAEQGEVPAGPPPPTPENPRDYLVQWFGDLETQLDNPATPGATRFGLAFFDFEETYWRERHRSNLLLVHYNDLKEDLAGEMQRIADFLDIAVPESVMPSLVQAACFEAMKKAGDAYSQSAGRIRPRRGEVHQQGQERALAGISHGRRHRPIRGRRSARLQARAWRLAGRRPQKSRRSEIIMRLICDRRRNWEASVAKAHELALKHVIPGECER